MNSRMISRFSYLLSIFVVAIFFASCNEDDSDDDFPSNVGIRGKILTQNEFQQPLYEERDGVELLLEVGFREFEVEGDNVGRWKLSGAPVGTYTITVEKEGFGTVVYRGIRISTVNPEYPVVEGFQEIPSFTLTEIPTTLIENVMLDLSFETVTTGMETDTIWSLDITGTMNPAPPPTGQAKGCRIFLETDEFVSKSDFIHQEHVASITAEFSTTVPDSVFDANQIGSGDILNVLIYADANFDQVIELQEGEVLFPNLGETPSDLASVALP